MSGATQDEVAERCGIYRTYLSRIEHGTANPSIRVLVALATTLNVKLTDLLLE
jgi:transcriptional regulator with XRE-family HTH domain